MTRKAALHPDRLPAALADHNRAHMPAPAIMPADLGHELAALEMLRTEGATAFLNMIRPQREALLTRLLQPVTGVGEASAPLRRRRTTLSSWTSVLSYARTRFANEQREAFAVVFLDQKNQHLATEVLNWGTVDHAPVYPREVMARALELGASALILIHNHPSGDPTPSPADVQMTAMIVGVAKLLSIAVHDHLVVGRDGIASLRQLGLM